MTTSEILLSDSALRNNLDFIRSLIGEDVRISSVVKSNAYGHGIEEFVPLAIRYGIDHFSVFSSDEAFRIMEIAAGECEVMIMGYLSDEDFDQIIKKEIQFYVFDLERLKKAAAFAKRVGKKAIIHLEIETGMNRTGIKKADMLQLVSLLNENRDYLHIKGLCTHYAGAESIANHVRIKRQLRNFNQTDKWLRSKGIDIEIRHTACSAASISYPKTRMDMVRIGILQYGFWPSKETFIHYIHGKESKADPLKGVLRWQSAVMSIKTVKEGEFISYGTAYQAQEDKRIAVVPVGYYHGYTRSLSNQGRVLINEQRADVIGMVNMNMLVCDVSHIEDIELGDEVVLIGKQGELNISVASFGEFNSMMNYELLTRLPSNISRNVII